MHDVDLARSYAVGDRARDIEAGRRAGTRAVLVRTGYGKEDEAIALEKDLADHVADNLYEAALWIVSDFRKHEGESDDR
jgi:phosphoglycolate phosphatase-like HAD superfamily hydrolase